MKKILLLGLLACASCSEKSDISTNLKYSIKDSSDEKGSIGNQEEVALSVVIPASYNEKQLDTIGSVLRHNNILVPRVDIEFFTEKFLDAKPPYAKIFYPNDDSVKKYTKTHDLYNEPRDLFLNGQPLGNIK